MEVSGIETTHRNLSTDRSALLLMRGGHAYRVSLIKRIIDALRCGRRGADLGRSSYQTHCRRRQNRFRDAVCAPSCAHLPLPPSSYRGPFGGRGARQRGFPGCLAPRPSLRGKIPGRHLAPGDRPPQGAFSVAAARLRTNLRRCGYGHRGPLGRSGNHAGPAEPQRNPQAVSDTTAGSATRGHRSCLLSRQVSGRSR